MTARADVVDMEEEGSTNPGRARHRLRLLQTLQLKQEQMYPRLPPVLTADAKQCQS
jgi:hypothetical protein